MRRFRWFPLGLVVGCATASVPAEPATQVAGTPAGPTAAVAPPAASNDLVPADQAALPPAVLNGQAELHCSISSSANGAQKLSLTSGQGLEFDVVVSPILDGVVETRGPQQGGAYRFTSHLAQPGKGTLSGVGAVTFETLETKVNVEVDRYQQPGGAGTALTFGSVDMPGRGIYVEFAGRARAANGDRYAFRVTLGAPGSGSGGSVTPASDANRASIAAKIVVIQAPQTTVVSATTVQKLR